MALHRELAIVVTLPQPGHAWQVARAPLVGCPATPSGPSILGAVISTALPAPVAIGGSRPVPQALPTPCETVFINSLEAVLLSRVTGLWGGAPATLEIQDPFIQREAGLMWAEVGGSPQP